MCSAAVARIKFVQRFLQGGSTKEQAEQKNNGERKGSWRKVLMMKYACVWCVVYAHSHHIKRQSDSKYIIQKIICSERVLPHNITAGGSGCCWYVAAVLMSAWFKKRVCIMQTASTFNNNRAVDYFPFLSNSEWEFYSCMYLFSPKTQSYTGNQSFDFDW